LLAGAETPHWGYNVLGVVIFGGILIFKPKGD